MRAQEFIRDLLDLMDRMDCGKEEPQEQASDKNHFKQIADLVADPVVEPTYANEPNEQYASAEAVTTNAGGGVNGPKQAADLRGNSFRLYPGDRN